MTKEKKELLSYSLDRIYNIGFAIEPEDLLEEYFAEKLMVIGTTADEKFISLDGVRTLIKHQKEQTQGLSVTFERKPIYMDLVSDENVAISVEDVLATININTDIIEFTVRSSAILEYKLEKWKLIHWHASKAEEVESAVDTFGIEEWKQKTIALEKLVAERTADLIAKNDELKTAIENLKSTQSQLIQSEKMASLGELTAGIAHEIQNPLNFVNNFSEVSNELLDEMNEELNKGDIEEAKAISVDIKQNLEKINHHGKRADAIVKGMLQHSRSISAIKEPTDINKLADEYLRLAYHGLRAKDTRGGAERSGAKSFNATMKTEFDESIGTIEIIPQDLGRVILNLINNAFYATNEKAQQNIEGYEPTVTVSTKKVEDKVEIKVTDNGNGIPHKVLDKIFQPFFTTKPTGQGTGLGLSLSYDIVKAHGGEIKVETKENEGTTFIICLTINQ